MCEGFLRIEMHALLHWFLFLERKEDARNSERIFFRGSKMLLQTNPVIRKKNLILVIKKKMKFNLTGDSGTTGFEFIQFQLLNNYFLKISTSVLIMF